VEKEEKAVRVRDLMTRNVISISVEKSVMEAASVMTEEGISSVLLKSGDEFLSISTLKTQKSKNTYRYFTMSKIRRHYTFHVTSDLAEE